MRSGFAKAGRGRMVPPSAYPASTKQESTNRFGCGTVISTGPGANPDSLYIAKLAGGKSLPVPGCPPRLGQLGSGALRPDYGVGRPLGGCAGAVRYAATSPPPKLPTVNETQTLLFSPSIHRATPRIGQRPPSNSPACHGWITFYTPAGRAPMIAAGADLCLAFHRDLANSKGTKDCVRQAIVAGTPVWLLETEEGKPKQLPKKSLGISGRNVVVMIN
jgi:hypothetical protein